VPSGTVRLKVGGSIYSGWKRVAVSRSLEAGAGAFDLTVSQLFPTAPGSRPIRTGQRCEVSIDDDRLIAGYVDQVEVSLSATDRDVTYRGRDALADLIDSAPDLRPSEWFNVGLLELAKQLAEPFGVPVRSEVADLGPPFPRVSLNAGQHAFELIAEHARYRRVLPISDGLGGLVFVRAGTERARAKIVEGLNLKSGTSSDDSSGRYSEYIVKGQATNLGNLGKSAGKSAGRAEDSEITRHRPLLIVADQAATIELCQQRAEWEALNRSARATRATVTVVDWRDATGALWRLNTLVGFESPSLALSGEFLISSVVYELSSDGTTTTLTLDRPDAFTVAPEPDPQKSGVLRSLSQ